MPNDPNDIEAVALLDEPVRRSLYEWVAGTGRAVGRDEADPYSPTNVPSGASMKSAVNGANARQPPSSIDAERPRSCDQDRSRHRRRWTCSTLSASILFINPIGELSLSGLYPVYRRGHISGTAQRTSNQGRRFSRCVPGEPGENGQRIRRCAFESVSWRSR